MKACIFDAFGTLFNLDNRLLQHIDHPAVQDILDYTRSKQLSYTWLHSLMEEYLPFDQLTRIALTDACEKHNAPLELVEPLSKLYFEPLVFDDVLPALKMLKDLPVTTGILSNGTRPMLDSGIQLNELDDYLDKVYSVNDIGVFKPAPGVYEMVIKDLNIQPEEVLFVSSNQWDVAGAATYGFQVAWVNRKDGFRESITKLKGVHVLSDLIGLKNLLGLDL